jgi:hypothetical protein
VAPSSYFMKSPPRQIHDDIAFNRVEAFIRGEDNETLVGTEKPVQARKRTLAKAHAPAETAHAPAETAETVGAKVRATAKAGVGG